MAMNITYHAREPHIYEGDTGQGRGMERFVPYANVAVGLYARITHFTGLASQKIPLHDFHKRLCPVENASWPLTRKLGGIAGNVHPVQGSLLWLLLFNI